MKWTRVNHFDCNSSIANDDCDVKDEHEHVRDDDCGECDLIANSNHNSHVCLVKTTTMTMRTRAAMIQSHSDDLRSFQLKISNIFFSNLKNIQIIFRVFMVKA